MLHFFKKVQLLNYIFPPYQFNYKNELKNPIPDFNMTGDYINENLDVEGLVDSDEMQIDKIYQRS